MHPSPPATRAAQPYDVIQLPYGEQTLWPDHCVRATSGAELHKDLDLPHAQLIIRKGCNPDIDSYSAFLEADRTTTTGLGRVLEGTRCRHGLSGWAGTRFLRDVFRAGCAGGRV